MTALERIRAAVRLGCRTAPALAVSFSLGCGEDKAAPPTPPRVTVDVVAQASIPIAFEFSGSLQAVKSIEVIPRVSGVIHKRNFEEGALVDEGAALYVIDPRPMQAQLDEDRAQLDKDRAHLDYLQSEAKRYSALYEQGVASQQQRDAAVAQAREFEAAARLDVASVERAELELGYASIEAPFAGRIQETRINQGELVTANQTVLTELVQIDPVYAVFSISRAVLFEIQRHVPGGIGPDSRKSFTAKVELPDGTLYPKRGRVDYLSAQIDPSTDTLEARAVFANTIGDDGMILIPGQYARVHLTVGEQPDALLVPQAAVVESQGARHVLVVDDQDVVEQRPIEVGRVIDDRYVALKGVKPGERVVVDGLQKAQPTKKVTPVTKAEQSPAASGS